MLGLHTRRGHAPAVPAAGPARQGVGAFSCRDAARANAGARPCARQPRAALGDGGRLRQHRCRRGVGVEGRLRGPRSGPGLVPAQIRQRDAHARGLGRGDARDADPPRRKARVADPPLGGIRTLPAILDADRARLCRRRGRSADPQRRRSRTVGRHRPAGDLRRARQSTACPERDRRDPCRTARPPVPRCRGHPAQRRADPRPSRSPRSGRASC